MSRAGLAGFGALAAIWVLRTKLKQVLQVRRAAELHKGNLPALCLPQTVAINLLLPPSADILINYEGKREVPQMKRERLCSFIFMDLDKRELDRDLEK